MTTTILVIPCYNEAKRLDGRRFIDFIDGSDDVSLLFVNDGSTDATQRVLDELVAQRPDRMTASALDRNSGKAEAVRQGLQRAVGQGADLVGFFDADLSTDLSEVPRFLAVFEERPELSMVFGSRVNLLGRRVRRKLTRHYIGRVFATLASWALRLPIYDTQCGAKIFRNTEELRQVLDTPFMSRWIFDVELIARFVVSRRVDGAPPIEESIYELPLMSWYDVAGSKLRFRDMFIVAGDMMRIWWRYLR